MASESRLEGNVFVNGLLRMLSITLPSDTVKNDNVTSGADIDADKLEHQHAIEYQQADGSDVVAATVPIHIVRGVSGMIVDIEVVCQHSPSGGDLAFTVDLQKANEGSPVLTTVLTGVITIDSTISEYEVEPGTINLANLAAGDTLALVIAVSGSTGSQGQGLIVTTTIREDAE